MTMRWSVFGGRRWGSWGRRDNVLRRDRVFSDGLIDDGAGRRVGGLEFPKSFGLGIAEEHLVGAKPGEVEYDTGERG